MKTILLIDDDKNVRMAISMTLRHCGYRVIEADSGSVGLELARQQLPDLILTDITMPDMDGQAVLKHIRQDPVLSNRQVVLMTGNPTKVSPRNGMEAGADDFLIKPVGLEDLRRCVEARLKRAQVHWRVEDHMLTELRSTLHSHLPHEFFTPLAGIIGIADILCSDLSSFSPAEVEDLLKDIHGSALRLHRTLKNYLLILDLQTSSKRSGQPMELLSPQVLKENLLSGSEIAIRRNRRSEDVVKQVEECAVLALAGDVAIIAEELVDNACNYSRQGTPIKINFDATGVLTITDSGRGMTPEEIEQIGIFQQFDRKKHAQQGLGLGLVLVQKLAAKCGAKFSIQSHISEGTEVKVAFQTQAIS